MAKKKLPRQLIRNSAEVLKDLFRENLASLGDSMVSQIMARAKRKKDLTALKHIPWKGENAYRQAVLLALSGIAIAAIQAARKEVPKAKKVKLAEHIASIKFGDDLSTNMDQLPPDLQAKLRKQAQLLVDTQLSDLEKNVSYQYADSFDTTDDLDTIQKDLSDVAIEYIDGQAIQAGGNLLAAKTVNESRNAFFFDSDVLEEIDAFIFTNGDPVTPICQDLNGTVFAKDDPNMFRYTPPLHWNCKSYIEPVLAGGLDGREIEPLRPSTAALDDEIQFSECSH